MENIFVEGLYSNKVADNAPEFILGKQSIHVEKLLNWLQNHKDLANEKGYINITVMLSKDGQKRYIAVDTYKKKEEINPETDVPF